MVGAPVSEYSEINSLNGIESLQWRSRRKDVMLPQSCDTMVALGPATVNGQTLFAKNSDRPEHEAQPLVLHERATHAPGTMTRCQFVELPEVPTTWRHVGSRPEWCWG